MVIQILHLCAKHEAHLPLFPLLSLVNHLAGLNRLPFQEKDTEMWSYNFNNLITTVMRDAVSFCYGSRQQGRRSQKGEIKSITNEKLLLIKFHHGATFIFT